MCEGKPVVATAPRSNQDVACADERGAHPRIASERARVLAETVASKQGRRAGRAHRTETATGSSRARCARESEHRNASARDAGWVSSEIECEAGCARASQSWQRHRGQIKTWSVRTSEGPTPASRASVYAFSPRLSRASERVRVLAGGERASTQSEPTRRPCGRRSAGARRAGGRCRAAPSARRARPARRSARPRSRRSDRHRAPC